jgi:hypothetical protein
LQLREEHRISEEAALKEGLKQEATESRCWDAARWTGGPKGEDAGAAESVYEVGRRDLRKDVRLQLPRCLEAVFSGERTLSSRYLERF